MYVAAGHNRNDCYEASVPDLLSGTVTAFQSDIVNISNWQME